MSNQKDKKKNYQHFLSKINTFIYFFVSCDETILDFLLKINQISKIFT
jgi:hypothetical protein